MKRLIMTLAAAMMVVFIFANSEASFSSTDEEVSMQVERGKGEVLLRLTIKDMSKYDHILIEKSSNNQNYFGQCKYITCSEEKTVNGVLTKIDKYPFPATNDVFYRVKTVTKDGISRAYPPVMLASSNTSQ